MPSGKPTANQSQKQSETVGNPTPEQIDRWKALQARAEFAGDLTLIALCNKAFSGNKYAQSACDRASKAGSKLKPFEVDVSSQYGAPHGRIPRTDASALNLRLARVDLDVGGYDKGGAYWGRGKEYVYCCWASYIGSRRAFVTYVRATDRQSAKAKILEKHPEATFWKS